MGERRYEINDTRFVFSEWDEGEENFWGCLCTFPHNDECFGEISKDRIASLALLGAATALSIYQPEKINKNAVWDHDHAIFPKCIPFWIRKQIYEQVHGETYPFNENGESLKV